MSPRRLLGIAASLRNARHGAGNRGLIDDLRSLETKDALLAYLSSQSRLIVEQFMESGRREGKDFLELYRNYKKLGGEAGLSNSETALAAALWAAHREGAEIEHLSLGEHFTPDGRQRDPDGLRAKLLAADGLLVSGPVYFGDRGSLAESLIGFIAGDLRLREALRGKIYGGIAVGAKRNGGQETTLIYQMLDMVNLGLLTVGNDSESTAQYGGTGYAGDVGTMHKDAEGIETSMGTGRRLAWVMKYFGASATLRTGPRVLFLVLQDAGGMATQTVKHLTTRFAGAMQASVVDVTGQRIERCVACDICPSTVGFDEEYRCVVKAKSDSMGTLHSALLHHDLIVPVVTSFQDPSLASKYQVFVERTRYIRRSDYTWSDAMVAPLVLEEPGDYRSLPIRMMTSFLRHHTVMSKPMMGYVRDGEVDNLPRIEVDFSRTLAHAARLASGRLALAEESPLANHYRPVGYVISSAKDVEDDRLERRKDPAQARREHLLADAQERLVEGPPAASAPAEHSDPEQAWNAGLSSRAQH